MAWAGGMVHSVADKRDPPSPSQGKLAAQSKGGGLPSKQEEHNDALTRKQMTQAQGPFSPKLRPLMVFSERHSSDGTSMGFPSPSIAINKTPQSGGSTVTALLESVFLMFCEGRSACVDLVTVLLDDRDPAISTTPLAQHPGGTRPAAAALMARPAGEAL